MVRCPLRFQLFPVSAMSAPSVQGCFKSTKIPGKGSRIFNGVWVWLALSQVVRAAWAAAAFAFGYLEFVIVSSAAAASAGAWFIFLFLEGVYGAAAALMNVATLGGSVTASFKLLFMFFEGSGAALVSVAVAVTAAAFMLLCAATAAAGAFGTVVAREFPCGLTDGGFTQISVHCVCWCLHISGLLCVFSFRLHSFRWSAASV